MTNHPRTWKYMRWCPKKETNCKECAYGCLNITHDEGRKPVDGDDMVAAMNKMDELNHWDEFCRFAVGKWGSENATYDVDFTFILWAMQPARFFDLLEQWLEKRNGKQQVYLF